MISLLTRRRRDDGSIVLALLAILVVTSVVALGLATIIEQHAAARHDVAFESALAGAENGLDKLVAQVQADPTVSSPLTVSGTDPTTGAQYTASATQSGTDWLVDATGTAHWNNGTVTRHVQATVTVGNLLSIPLFGDKMLTAKGIDSYGTAVERYDSSVSSDVCDARQTPSPQVSMAGSADTRMCSNVNGNPPQWGVAGTNGSLSMRGTDLQDLAEVDIFNSPPPGYQGQDKTGTCLGDNTVCGQAVLHYDKVDYIRSTLCANGIGAGTIAYDGSTALAANAVYDFTDVTLNATTVANLDLPGSHMIICFNGKLSVAPGVAINGQPATDNPSLLNPRPPSTLLLISTAPANGTVPQVDFGGGASGNVFLSAVVYAPDADCTANNGHVDVYGMLVCGSVGAPNGVSVHFDTQVDLTTSFDRPVTVSNWHEVH